MRRYVPSVEGDLAVADWWAAVARSGDLAHMLPAPRHPLGAFLDYFRDAVLLVELDAEGIWLACWAKPWLGSAFAGLWVRAGRRSRRALPSLLTALHGFLAHWPALIVLTWVDGRRGLYEQAGVTFAPEPIPGLIDGQPSWLGWLTAEGLAGAFPLAPAGPEPAQAPPVAVSA